MSKMVKLGELYSVHNGLTKERKYFGTGYPFLSFSTVFNNFFIPEKLNDLVESTEKERHNYDIKRGDVFVTRTSETSDELGMSSVALKDYPDATYNGFAKRLRPIDSTIIDPVYIGYYFRMPEFRNGFQSFSTMTTRASLKNEDLLGMEVWLPDMKIQRAIASILKKYDELIESNNQQISLLEEAAQRLYKEWFIDLHFPGYENCKIVNGIPEGWSYKTLGEITDKFATGLNPRKNFTLGHGNNYYVTIKNMSNNTVILNDKCDRIDDAALEKINSRSDLKSGDLLFSGIGTIGRVALIYKPPVNWNISESVFTMRAKENVSAEYLFLTLLDSRIQSYCQQNAHGAAQRGIRMADLKAYSMVVCDSVVMHSFTELVRPIINRCNKLRDENIYLDEARNRLLPKLMSGEIEV